MDRILRGDGTGSDGEEESHDPTESSSSEEDEEQQPPHDGENRLQSAISQLRNGQPSHQRQSPDSTHSLPQAPPPYQSPPLQSLDLDFSQQQPGPSGLHLIASPPNQSQGPLRSPPSNIASGGTGGQMVPDARARGSGEGSSGGTAPSRPVFPPPPVFQIPLSQDVLAQTSTQDISTGFSQSVDSSSQSLSAGPPLMSLPLGFDHLPEAQRELEEEERQQREQAERDDQELLQQQKQELMEFMNQPSVTPQPPPEPPRVEQHNDEESFVADPLLRNVRSELEERETRRQQRHRQRVYRVPGTESSQSSDEGLAASFNRAITRAVHKTVSGVPSLPSQLTTASLSAAKNQAMTSTASSESELSSSELQALKEDNENVKIGDQRVVFASPGKVDKRPSQKVPKLSSKKLAQIHVKLPAGKTLPTGSVVSTTSVITPAQTPPPESRTGAPSSSSSLVSPSTTVASADSEPSTETEETATEMDTEPEATLEPAAAGTSAEASMEAMVDRNRESVIGEPSGRGIDRSSHEEQQRNGVSVGSRVDQGSLSLSEPESYIGGESGSDVHVRQSGAVDHPRPTLGSPPSLSCTPTLTSQSSSEEEVTRQTTISANPASWGAETDASTEYPGTQTTSSSGTGSSGGTGSTSVTLSTTTDSSQPIQSGGSATLSSQPAEFDTQTQSQTFPISSTPCDESGSYSMHPPGVEMSLLVRKPLKRTSDETTTSSATTTSSSSYGHLEKIKGDTNMRGQGSLEIVTPTRLEQPTSQSQDGQETAPFALESPTPPETPPNQRKQADENEVVPLTPPEVEHPALPDISPTGLRTTGVGISSSSGSISSRTRSRRYLRQEDSQDLGNQLPSWMSEVLPTVDEGQESQTPTQSGSKRDHDTSSSSEQSSQSPRPPPPKRRRARSSRSSSSDGNIPKWDRERNVTEGSSNIGPSEQAQPTNIPSTEKSKSSSSGNGQAQMDTNQVTSPSKLSSQSISSSQSGTLSGASGTSSSLSGPNTSSSSGTTSSGSGYPPSSSHSSGSPEDPPPSNDKKGSSGSGSGGDSSQQPLTGSDESFEQSGVKKDQSSSSVGEDNMDTGMSQVGASLQQENTRQSLLDQSSQTEGTQDSFLKRRDNSSSLSSREGGESGYIGGSSSVSVLASISPSKSTPGSLSAPLPSLSDSQETLESSVSCIEDSVPVTLSAQPQARLAPVTSNTRKSTQAIPNSKDEFSQAKKLNIVDDSVAPSDQPKHGEDMAEAGEDMAEASEDEIDNKISSELLPLEPPHSPELLNDDVVDDGNDDKMDTADSPVIAFQAPELPCNSDVTKTIERADSPVIALQSSSSKAATFMSFHVTPTEVDMLEPESSQGMDTDMISTQSSFVLQLADSQSTLTPFSPFKQSDQKQSENESSRGLSKDDESIRNSEEVEQCEKELPNLVELKEPSEVDITNDKQKVPSITSKVTDSTSVASVHTSTSNPAVPVAGNQTVSEGDKPPMVKSKPVPLYESLICDDSNSESIINSALTKEKEAATSISRLSELQHSVDTSQITNSGTPFQIHLPQNNLHPQFSMTPPTQRPKLLSPVNSTQSVPGQHKTAQSASNSSTSSDVPMVSPSELDTSVFKSPTPSEMSESQNQKKTNVDKSHQTTQDTNSSNGTQNARREIDSGADTSETNVIISADKISCDDTNMSEHPMNVDIPAVDINKDTSDKQDANPVQSNDKSPAAAGITRQICNSSPRMCLSLKKVKVTSSSAWRSLNMNDTGPTEDRNPLETSAQFVLGVGANEGDLDSSVESQFQLPAVEVPSDSQFELSGDSQSLFQIQRPSTSEPSAQPPVSSSSSRKQPEKRGNPSSKLFAFVNPALSSRQAIKRAKENYPTETLSPHSEEPIPSHGSSRDDPYVYDSQNMDTEVDFIMQRRAKRAATRPSTKKPPNENHPDASGQGGHEEENAPEHVPTFSCEPPLVSTAVRRPHAQQSPLHIRSGEGGSRDDPSSHDIVDQTRSGSQSAADTTRTVIHQQRYGETPSGSQQPAGDTTSGSQLSPRFLSPSLILPSTSTGRPLPSVSPSAAVPSSLVNELKKRAGLDRGGDYQLKLVKVVRTIVEERHVFAEDVQQDRVIQGSGRSWIEHSPPSTQAIEQVSLSPAITTSSQNQNSAISFTMTLSSSNFYQHDLNSSILITPTPLTTQPTVQLSSMAPFPAHNTVHTLPPLATVTSTPLVPISGSAFIAHSSRSNSVENENEPEIVAPEGDLPCNSRQSQEPVGPSTSNVPSLPSTSKDAAQNNVHNPSLTINSNTVNNQVDEDAPGNPLTLDSEDIPEDANYDNFGNTGHDSDRSSDGSDSVIVLHESTPAGRKQPVQLDSSEDFQESPLPKTPRRTAMKKATPQSHAKKTLSGVAARKRGLASASKGSPQVRTSVAKKVIVTRSMATSSGNSSVESGTSTRPAKEFYSGRTVPSTVAKVKPNSTTPANRGQVNKPPHAAIRPTQGITTASQATKPSSANRQTPATARPTATVRPTTATKHAALSTGPCTPTLAKSTPNTLTKSTPTSKPSRPISTKCTLTSKPPGGAAIRQNSTSAHTEESTTSSVASTSNTSKIRQKGTKRRITDDKSSEAQTASPRKKARSSKPGSPRKDGVNSEIAFRTRARDHLAMSPEASRSSVCEGSMVMARWGDRNWYPANVLNEDKNGKYSIMYADGDTGVVPRNNLFPLDYLELDVPVVITANKLSLQSKSSGLFAGFNKDSAQQFFVEDASHMRHGYDLNRLCLPQESADICLIKHTGQPYTELSRKRGRSSVLASPRDRETGPAAKKKKSSCSPNQSLTVECEEDVPSGQKSLFHGYTFMLTQKPKEDGRSATPPIVPINRDTVAQQMINRRGKVVDNYDEDTLVFRRRFFVLSDTCCRTHKYLIGLALGVPCIRYGWIKDCIDKGKVLDHSSYILPAGHDQSNTIPWSSRDNRNIMDGIIVHVFGGDEKFKDHWNAILRAANAKTCSRLPSSNQISRSRSAAELCGTVVVSELKYVTKSLVHQVTNTGMKLVNTEWIVQSLIHGKARTDYKRFSLK